MGEKEIFNQVDVQEFESLELALEEIRRRYDDEENRRNAIETKISGLLALDAILLSVVGVGSLIDSQQRILVVILLLLSAIIAWFGLKPQEYKRPISNVRDYVRFAQDSKEEFQSYFLEKYLVALHYNEKSNEKRYSRFNTASIMTMVSVIFLVGSIVWESVNWALF